MNHLARETLEKIALSFVSAILFVGFFRFNSWIFSTFEYSEGISWVFLPAGFRIILVLVLGLPGGMGLMLGSWFIDRELLTQSGATLSILNGVVSGLTPWLVMKYLNQRHWLSPNLQTLKPKQLLSLTLIFAAASASSHQLLWMLMARPHLNIWVDIWPMFIGDALGALLMLYGLKFVLDRLDLKDRHSFDL